jgi:hypothetical protein
MVIVYFLGIWINLSLLSRYGQQPFYFRRPWTRLLIWFPIDRYISFCPLSQRCAPVSFCHKTNLKYFHNSVYVCLCYYDLTAAAFRARWCFVRFKEFKALYFFSRYFQSRPIHSSFFVSWFIYRNETSCGPSSCIRLQYILECITSISVDRENYKVLVAKWVSHGVRNCISPRLSISYGITHNLYTSVLLHSVNI